jgi:hypothetical protein
MQNSNGQRHGGAALKNKLTGVPGWHPLLINITCHRQIHHQRLPHHRNIFSPSNAIKYDMMTKGGLSPDTQENRASSGNPPPKKYQMYHSATSRVIVPAKQAKSRREVVPFVPKMDTTKTSVKDKSIPHFQGWK